MISASALPQHLKTLDYTVVYNHWEGTAEFPRIAYVHGESPDFKADNHNYVDVTDFDIELYTTKRDKAAEKAIQDLLKSLDVPYSKTGPTYVESEKFYITTYSIRLIGE